MVQGAGESQRLELLLLVGTLITSRGGTAVWLVDRHRRSPHDARLVQQFGGDDRGVQLEQRQEAIVVLRHAAAHHEQVGPEQPLERGVVQLQAPRPAFVAELLARLGGRRRPGLGVVAGDLQVTEFGVRHQPALVDHGRTDAGAERRHDDQAGVALGGTESHLGKARSVSVVDQDDVALQSLAEQFVDVDADPRLIEICHPRHNSVHHRGGHGDADRRVADLLAEVLDDLGHHIGASRRGRLLRRGNAQSIGGQFASGQVDGGALDTRSANVDAQDGLRSRSHEVILAIGHPGVARARCTGRVSRRTCQRAAGLPAAGLPRPGFGLGLGWLGEGARLPRVLSWLPSDPSW